MNQAQMIHEFNKTHHEPFNPSIFTRSEDKIIDYLKDIITTCSKKIYTGNFFGIEVENFEVIDDYRQCQEILAKYQENAMNKSAKLRAAMDNRYAYIDLKPTDLKLLITTFKIETYEGVERFESILAIPRIVDKFFVNINDNKRSLMFQLVESTYNNATSSSSKSKMNTLKSNLSSIRFYRVNDTKTDINGEEVTLVNYEIQLFKKFVPVADYIFAQMGLEAGISFLGLSGFVHVTNFNPANCSPNPELFYIFCPRKSSGIYIWVPKEFLKNNSVAQHVVSTLCNELTKKVATFPEIYTREVWIHLLGRHFNISTPYYKGISVLSSLNTIYDKITKRIFYLPEVDKKDVFCILRWAIYEFDAIYLKSNLDLRLKRIRCEEYVAAMFAPKFSKAIYTLCDMNERVTLRQIKKRLAIDPLFIINELAKSSLSNFHDMVSDVDCFVATKVSNQGVSGISDGTSKSLPESYLYLNPSHIGILGLSESSASSVGSSTNLTPFTKFDENGYFSTWGFKEPDTYREKLIKQRQDYIDSKQEIEVVQMKNMIRDNTEVPELSIGKLEISPETLQKLILMNK